MPIIGGPLGPSCVAPPLAPDLAALLFRAASSSHKRPGRAADVCPPSFPPRLSSSSPLRIALVRSLARPGSSPARVPLVSHSLARPATLSPTSHVAHVARVLPLAHPSLGPSLPSLSLPRPQARPLDPLQAGPAQGPPADRPGLRPRVRLPPARHAVRRPAPALVQRGPDGHRPAERERGLRPPVPHPSVPLCLAFLAVVAPLRGPPRLTPMTPPTRRPRHPADDPPPRARQGRVDQARGRASPPPLPSPLPSGPR